MLIVSEIFEVDNGIQIGEGISILGGEENPSSLNISGTVAEGTLYHQLNGNKFRMIEGNWIQIANKHGELLIDSIYDDIVPSHATMRLGSPDIIGEFEIAGEVVVI